MSPPAPVAVLDELVELVEPAVPPVPKVQGPPVHISVVWALQAATTTTAAKVARKGRTTWATP
jgi:hypothetical protein